MQSGGLREALIDAAEHLLRAEGPAKLSLRGVARRAGVSHAAPYNHFKNKNALFLALKDRGAERLDQAMADAQAVAPKGAIEQFVATGLGYLRFASRHPHIFKLMHSQEFCAVEAEEPPVDDASWQRLVAAVRGVRDSRGLSVDETAVLTDCLLAWSVVHGLALLKIDAGVAALQDDDEIARAVVERLASLYQDG